MSAFSAHIRHDWSHEKEINGATLQIIYHRHPIIDPSNGGFSHYYETLTAKEKGGGN